MIQWSELPLRLAVSCLPTLAFLVALTGLDSYKLVRPQMVLKILGAGAFVAFAIIVFWETVRPSSEIDPDGIQTKLFIRYIAPVVEEFVKALVVYYLIRSNKVGFLVDAAILGFAVGAGFAVIENTYYIRMHPQFEIPVLIIRGFGTAVMHGGTTAIFAMITTALGERRKKWRGLEFVPGLLLAMVVHSFFNHLATSKVSPVVYTVAILVALPPLLVLVFVRSEAAVRRWLDVGLDADAELLGLIHSGLFTESTLGRYLLKLTERFRGEVVADILCYLRLHVELSMQAKGVLMMRGAGFRAEPDDETKAKFQEMTYLEKSIGPTGKLAIKPFLRVRSRDLWQLYMLKGASNGH